MALNTRSNQSNFVRFMKMAVPRKSSLDSDVTLSGEYLDAEVKRKLEQVDERLSCAVCLGRFDDPRMLDCRHSFCRKCLVDVLTKRLWDPQYPVEDNELQCPKCRVMTKLEVRGVEDLPVNYDLKDVVELFEKQQDLRTLPSPFSPTTYTRQLSTPLLCRKHEKGLEYFCKTCDDLLCGDCHIQPIHRGHNVCFARDVLEEEHELLKTTCLENAENVLLNVTVGVTEVSDMIESLKDKGEAVKQHIQEQFQEIQEALAEREQSLLSTTDAIIAKKITTLEQQGESLKRSQQDLSSLVEHLKKVLQRKEDFSFLREKKQIVSRVSEAVGEAQLKERQPLETTKEGPDWYLPRTLHQNAMQYGEVFCKPCPSKFTAFGEGLGKAFLDVEAKFVIQARDKFSQRSYVSGNVIDVTIQGPDPTINTLYTILEEEKGQYVVRYTPSQIGYHALVVTADGKLIVDGERRIIIFKNKDYLGMNVPQSRISKQHLQSNVSTMKGVCVLPGNKIVFADAFCLRVVSPEGELIHTIGSFGNGLGQFCQPLGLAANKHGQIFVSDSTNHRVEKFTSDGRFLLMFGVNGTKNGNLMYPEGVALLGEDKVFVADRGNNRIQVFSQKNGKYLSMFGRKGNGPGQLDSPCDLAIDTKLSRILVSDTGNRRIQAFTLDGKPLTRFGNPQGGSVYLRFPYFIATDENGFILVTETKSNCVSILTPRGILIRHLGTQGDAPGKFRNPYGICLNSKGQVIVTDSSTHCIQTF